MDIIVQYVLRKKTEEAGKSGFNAYAWRASALLKLMRNGAFSLRGTEAIKKREFIFDAVLPTNPGAAFGRLITAILETAGTHSGLNTLDRICKTVSDYRAMSADTRKTIDIRKLMIEVAAENPIYGDQVIGMVSFINLSTRLIAPESLAPDSALAKAYFEINRFRYLTVMHQRIGGKIRRIKECVSNRKTLSMSSSFTDSYKRLMDGLVVFLNIVEHFSKPPRTTIFELNIEELESLLEDKFHYGGQKIPKNKAAIIRSNLSYDDMGKLLVDRHDTLFSRQITPETKLFYDAAREAYSIIAVRSDTIPEVYRTTIRRPASEFKKMFQDAVYGSKTVFKKTATRVKLESPDYPAIHGKTIADSTYAFMISVESSLSDYDICWPQLPCTKTNVVVFSNKIGKFMRLVSVQGASSQVNSTRFKNVLSRLDSLDYIQNLGGFFKSWKEPVIIVINSKPVSFAVVEMDDVLGNKFDIVKVLGHNHYFYFMKTTSTIPKMTPELIFPALKAAIHSGCGDLADRNFEYSTKYSKFVFIDADKGAAYPGTSLADKISAIADKKFPYIKRNSAALIALANRAV